MKVARDVSQVLNRALEQVARQDRGDGTVGVGDIRRARCARQQRGRAFRELGVRRGDRVAACLPNDIDILVAFHGAMRMGAIWVGVNKALAAPEQAYILRDSGARGSCWQAETVARVSAELGTLPDLRATVTAGDLDGSDGSWRRHGSGNARGRDRSDGAGRDRVYERHHRVPQGRGAFPRRAAAAGRVSGSDAALRRGSAKG